MRGLRQHDESPLHRPPDRHLSWGAADAFGDRVHLPVFEAASGAQRTVCLQRDTPAFTGQQAVGSAPRSSIPRPTSRAPLCRDLHVSTDARVVLPRIDIPGSVLVRRKTAGADRALGVGACVVFLGSWLSGFFIIATDAWMQHPVGYTLGPNGQIELHELSGADLQSVDALAISAQYDRRRW